MGTAASGGRRRLARLGTSLLLMIPLLTVTAASEQDLGQGSGQDGAGARPLSADSAGTRVAYAGTRHRSLGRVADDTSSTPLFGAGPAHFDVQPSALGDTMVFAGRRDEKDPQIYLRSADGSVRRLTSGRDAAHPRLTPDGRAVVSTRPNPAARAAGSSATCGWCAPTAPA
ncbi:hypothetical protein SUDANB106_05649 [Streptomyces sp. enrichment culture]